MKKVGLNGIQVEERKMSVKLKKIVLYLKLVVTFLLSRPFSNSTYLEINNTFYQFMSLSHPLEVHVYNIRFKYFFLFVRHIGRYKNNLCDACVKQFAPNASAIQNGAGLRAITSLRKSTFILFPSP